MGIKEVLKKAINPTVIFWVIASFILAEITGLFFTWRYFQIENKIDLLDILSLTVTLFLAIIISLVIEKNKSDNRVLKDILIKRVGEIEIMIIEVQHLISSRKVEANVINNRIKKIRMSLTTLKKLFQDKSLFKIDESRRKQIEILIMKTETIISSIGHDYNYSAVSESNVTYNYYTQEFLIKIDSKLIVSSNDLLQLQIRINNL